jgi:hypothetical protein
VSVFHTKPITSERPRFDITIVSFALHTPRVSIVSPPCDARHRLPNPPFLERRWYIQGILYSQTKSETAQAMPQETPCQTYPAHERPRRSLRTPIQPTSSMLLQDIFARRHVMRSWISTPSLKVKATLKSKCKNEPSCVVKS